MNKREWKIIYGDYSGIEKKAVNFLSAEIGRITNRDKGVYTLHVLPCESFASPDDKNIIVVGMYEEMEIVKKVVNRSEIPENGYLIKVMDSPQNPSYKMVIITAQTAQNVFYAAVDFIDDYLMYAAPLSGGLKTPCEVFDSTIPDYYYTSAPTTKKRSIFTWGHPINDYRKYIDNIARLKINQLIVWNDFLPINHKDIVDYAHEYGIELIWGYAWGWSTNCKSIDLDRLDELKEEIIQTFIRDYKDNGDGIYFQSFTELGDEYISGKLIAEVVANFVNDVSEALFEICPKLHIQFGLHATSIKNHMEFIGRVNKKIEIVWEDCGTFPYHYIPRVEKEDDFVNALRFTDEIISLRECAKNALVYKGMMTMDWSKFVNQKGPYVMGIAAEETIQNDIEMLKPIWRSFQGDWMRYGRYVHTMTRYVTQKTGDNINLCIAGALDGGIWFPEALCAQIMWNCNEDYDAILERVGKRQCIVMG